MNEEIFDVILQTTGHFRTDIHTFQENRPPKEGFVLSEEFWVGRLPYDVNSKLIFEACDPAGFNYRPARQYGMHYAFCRRVWPDNANYYEWDSDRRIGITLFMSRLIRPTTIANRYSARLYFQDHELRTVVAGPTQGLGAYAWVVAKDNWRDWLSVSELEQLRNLSALYDINAPDRVRRARKHIDNAFHAYYLDQRFASLVTSFESLLKVSDYKSTKQFASRAPKLAEMLGYELTGTEAEAMYKDRSAFVHGSEASFEELSDDLIEQYNRFERVIRLALLRASTESEFAKMFYSPESVEKTFGK
jgi:hypothetical protein